MRWNKTNALVFRLSLGFFSSRWGFSIVFFFAVVLHVWIMVTTYALMHYIHLFRIFHVLKHHLSQVGSGRTESRFELVLEFFFLLISRNKSWNQTRALQANEENLRNECSKNRYRRVCFLETTDHNDLLLLPIIMHIPFDIELASATATP